MQMSCSYQHPLRPAAILIAAAAMLPGLALAGTASIRGVVLDPSGRQVVGARVETNPARGTVFTGENGEFRIERLAPGQYRVRATHEAFDPTPAETVRLGEGAAVELVLKLPAPRANHVQLDVIGGGAEEALRDIPGSASLIDRLELTERRPADANEMLRTLPGVHIREDSGPAGTRLNIGVRGLNPDRSRTLLVLEDGVPVALAPYGEPEMYYSPQIDRMSRVELLKGSGSIVHGPQTIGGVLNFITPDPPPRPQGEIELAGGQRGLFVGQASYGATTGPTAWYVNYLRKQGDGWRRLFFGISDLTAKVNLTLAERHRVGVKLGVYEEGSNSTYLGLTEAQFVRDANDNAVPSDSLGIRRSAGSLHHQWVPAQSALVSTNLFGYSTRRYWRRQDFDRAPHAGVLYRGVTGDPAIPGDAIYLRDSATNNNREFEVGGVESRLSLDRGRHRLEAGVRYLREAHHDRRIDGARFDAGSGALREHERRSGQALSGYVQQRWLPARRLSFTPGLRLERYGYRRHILRQPVAGIPADVDLSRGDSVFQVIPGVGVNFQPWSALTLFAGVHRGFAPPRVKDAITREGVSLDLDAERSWNSEAGARLEGKHGLRVEATWFETDFQNQIIPAAVSGGAATSMLNAGRTLHRGVESLAEVDWSRLLGRPLGFFTGLRHTWLPVARFTAGPFHGNRLPYAPGSTLSVSGGYRHRRGFTVHLDGTRVGAQYADNRQTMAPSADGTVGLLDPYWVWNLSAGHQIRRERFTLRPFVSVKNLADALYISSRAPQGIQPGMFRQINAGMKWQF